MNKARIVAAIVLPIAFFYLSCVFAWFTVFVMGGLDERLFNQWFWLGFLLLFWLVSGLGMGAFFGVIALPLQTGKREKLARLLNRIFRSFNAFSVATLVFLTFGEMSGASFVVFGAITALTSPIVFGVLWLLIYLHNGCFGWGQLETEHFLQNRGGDFFLGQSTPWEKEREND